jgi:hypothetical protein
MYVVELQRLLMQLGFRAYALEFPGAHIAVIDVVTLGLAVVVLVLRPEMATA